MASKDYVTEEKGIAPSPEGSAQHGGFTGEREDFMTRNGLNLKSFQRRPVGPGILELDKSMKTRHLHMIAIGGSIGAGFFVGSGGALNKGVSWLPRRSSLHTLIRPRVPARSCSISPSWVL
jgi:amino acid transporter